MISAPSSSSASCVRALTEACVPTGMKNGVSTVPWGVVRRPRRAPDGSVFATSNEKLTRRVYQERDWNCQKFSKRHWKMRESRDGERGPEIRSDSSNEPEGAKIDRGRKQDQERPADDSPYILRDFRSLSALFICGLLLGLWQSLDT